MASAAVWGSGTNAEASRDHERGVSESPDIGSSLIASGQWRIDDSRELIRGLSVGAWGPAK